MREPWPERLKGVYCAECKRTCTWIRRKVGTRIKYHCIGNPLIGYEGCGSEIDANNGQHGGDANEDERPS